MKILTVDDDPKITTLLADLIKKEGFEAIVASSGEEAFSKLQQETPELIFLDHELGDTTGLEIVNQLKSDVETASIPIIMISGVDARENIMGGYRLGIDRYITKPFDIQVVADCMHAVLRRKNNPHFVSAKDILDHPDNLRQVDKILFKDQRIRMSQTDTGILMDVLMETAEQTRVLAYELHDNFGQLLAILKMTNDGIIAKRFPSKRSIRSDLQESNRIIAELIAKCRNFSHELAATQMNGQRPLHTLEEFVSKYEGSTGIRVQFATDLELVNFEEIEFPIFFRLFHEVFLNIERHANAKHIALAAEQENGTLRFTIKDDGKGFDMNKESEKPGLGLDSMSSLIQQYGGNISIWSEPGKGAQITIELPRLGPLLQATGS